MNENQKDISEQQVSTNNNLENVPSEVGQVAQKPTQIHNKEKSHWAFIIALFVFVGVFVVLLPLLVKIFGY